MHLLPPLAYQSHYSLADLITSYEWYKNADNRYQRLFQDQRRNTVKQSFCLFANELHSSGSTGLRKTYYWGPNFSVMNDFYHRIIMEKLRFPKTIFVNMWKLQLKNQPNSFNITRQDLSYCPQMVSIEIYQYGPVPGLKDVLAGKNVYLGPSAAEVLLDYTDFLDCLEPGTSMIFTGEVLNHELRNRLTDFDLRDTMRCWDGGATFFTCPYGNRHWLDFLAETWLEKDQLLSNDLFNITHKHLNYWNGDRLEKNNILGICRCGLPIVDIMFRNRSDFLYFVTEKGTILTYKWLTHYFVESMREQGVPEDQLPLIAFGKGTDEWEISYILEVSPEILGKIENSFQKKLGYPCRYKRSLDFDPHKLKKMYWLP